MTLGKKLEKFCDKKKMKGSFQVFNSCIAYLAML